MIRALVICLAVLTLACQHPDNPAAPSGTWSLSKLLDEDASGYKTPITFTFDTVQNKAAGFAGCNRYFSDYRSEKSSIRFHGIGSTKMFCEAGMNVENEYLRLLEQVRAFNVANDRLFLLRGDSVLLEFTRNR